MRAFSILLAAAALVLAVSVSGAAPAAKAKPWFGAYGAWSGYSMGDVNRDIGDFNAELAGTGYSMDEITNGFGFGALLGVDLNPQFAVGVAAEHLLASTDFTAEGVTLTYDLPANTFCAFGEYRLPTEGTLGFRLGAAAGLVATSGSLELIVPGLGGGSADVTGTGPMFQFYGTGEMWSTPQLAVTATLGYRYANVSELDVAGITLRKFGADYSGILARAGLKFYLTK